MDVMYNVWPYVPDLRLPGTPLAMEPGYRLRLLRPGNGRCRSSQCAGEGQSSCTVGVLTRGKVRRTRGCIIKRALCQVERNSCNRTIPPPMMLSSSDAPVVIRKTCCSRRLSSPFAVEKDDGQTAHAVMIMVSRNRDIQYLMRRGTRVGELVAPTRPGGWAAITGAAGPRSCKSQRVGCCPVPGSASSGPIGPIGPIDRFSSKVYRRRREDDKEGQGHRRPGSGSTGTFVGGILDLDDLGLAEPLDLRQAVREGDERDGVRRGGRRRMRR